MYDQRHDLKDTDPLMYTLSFMKDNNPLLHGHIEELVQRDDILTNDRLELCTKLRATPIEKTKLRLYMPMTPDLSVHGGNDEQVIEDNLRISFTRIRLCSHKLRSETGRWSGTPPDQRICPHCLISVQDERHILECPATRDIRTMYNVNTDDIHAVLENPSMTDLLCLKKCLKLLQSNKSE